MSLDYLIPTASNDHRAAACAAPLEMPDSRRDSGLSADDLAYVLAHATAPEARLAGLLDDARRSEWNGAADSPQEAFAFPRIMHSLGSALLSRADVQSAATGCSPAPDHVAFRSAKVATLSPSERQHSTKLSRSERQHSTRLSRSQKRHSTKLARSERRQ